MSKKTKYLLVVLTIIYTNLFVVHLAFKADPYLLLHMSNRMSNGWQLSLNSVSYKLPFSCSMLNATGNQIACTVDDELYSAIIEIAPEKYWKNLNETCVTASNSYSCKKYKEIVVYLIDKEGTVITTESDEMRELLIKILSNEPTLTP